MRDRMKLFAVAGCLLSQSGGFEKETATMQGYIAVVQQLSSGSDNSSVSCVAPSDPALKSVTIAFPSGSQKAPEIRIQENGKALENLMLLDFKVELKAGSEKLFLQVLDGDTSRALEVALERNGQGAWIGNFTDVGAPGNVSQTFTLNCK